MSPGSFKKFQPYTIIGENYAITDSGYFVIPLIVNQSPVGHLDHETLYDVFIAASKNLPDGTNVHMQDVFGPQKILGKTNSGVPSLDWNMKMLNSKEFNGHISYIFLAFDMKYRVEMFNTELYKGFLKSGNKEVNEIPTNVQQYFYSADRFGRALNNSKYIKVSLMGKNEFINYAKTYSSLSSFFDPSTYVPGEIKNENNHVSVGSKKAFFYSMSEGANLESRVKYQKYINNKRVEEMPTGVLYDLNLGLEVPHIVNFSFVVHDNKKFGGLVKKWIKKTGTTAIIADNEQAAIALKTYYTALAKNVGKCVSFSFNIMGISSNDQEERNIRGLIVEKADHCGIKIIEENYSNLEYFKHCFGGATAVLPRYQLGFLEQVVYMKSFETHGQFSKRGLPFRTISGGLIYLDLMAKMETYNEFIPSGALTQNMVILGETNSGKSNFWGNDMDYILSQKGHVLLIDKGDSQKKRTLMTEKSKYYEAETLSFNPVKAFLQEYKYAVTHDDKSFAVDQAGNFLMGCIDSVIDQSKREFTSKILKDYIIKSFYDHQIGINSEDVTFDTLYDYFIEYVKKLQEDTENHDIELRALVARVDFDTMILAFKSFYSGGRNGVLLNSKEHIDIINDQLVVFETDKISRSPEIYHIVVMCILQTAASKINDPRMLSTFFCIAIDEATFFLKNEYAAEFTAGTYQTIRKKYGCITFLDQSLDTLATLDAKSGIAGRIMSNTSYFILLKSKTTKKNLELFERYIDGFDEETAKLLRSIKNEGPYRQFVLITAEFQGLFQFEMSPESLLLANTDNELIENKLLLENYKKIKNVPNAVAKTLKQVGKDKPKKQ